MNSLKGYGLTLRPQIHQKTNPALCRIVDMGIGEEYKEVENRSLILCRFAPIVERKKV